MDDFNLLPESDHYLVMILLTPAGPSSEHAVHTETMRSMAGLILKNNLRRRDPLPRETMQFMRRQGERLFAVLGERMGLVRNTMGTVLASVACRLGRNLSSLWPEFLPTLVRLASCHTSRAETVEAVAEALAKICEDASDELMEDSSSPVSSLLLPCFLQLCSRSGSGVASEAAQVAALTAINCFIYHDNAIAAHLESFLAILSELSASPQASPRMKRVICQSLNLLMDAYPDEMQPVLPSVLDYMLRMTALHRPDERDEDKEALALEACEFWLSLAERDSAVEHVTPILPQLLPVLMFNTIYADDDPDLLDSMSSEDNATRSEAFKPRHATLSFHGNEGREEGEVEADDSDESSKGGRDDEESFDSYGSWTLRKCSAATIDVLASTVMEHDLMPHLLPLINSYMAHSDWRHQEAGILALGAISEGCSEAIDPHLPQIVPFLLHEVLSSPVPVVKAISLWTLGRYASSFVESAALQEQAFSAILRAMLDSHGLVQKAACTALGVFAERCTPPILSHLSHTIEMCTWALDHYASPNLINLLDSLGQVATAADESNGLAFDSLYPRLLQLWESAGSNYDALLMALLECFCSVLSVAGAQCRQYAPQIMQRSLQLSQSCLVRIHAAIIEEGARGETGIYDVAVESDVCMLALDIVGALARGFQHDLLPITHSSPISIESLLVAALEGANISVNVKQAAYALVGDLVVHCPSALSCHVSIGRIVQAISRDMDVMQGTTSSGAANNAVWALGELIVRFTPQLSNSLSSLSASLCRILGEYRDNSVSRGYLENVAVTLGRSLASVAPPQKLSAIMANWFDLIATVSNPDERSTAWSPMLSVILKDPSTFLRPDAILPLCQAVSVYRDAPPQLEASFHSLLSLLRDQLVGTASWQSYRKQHLSAIPEDFFARFSL